MAGQPLFRSRLRFSFLIVTSRNNKNVALKLTMMAAVTLLPASLQNAMQEIVERTSQSGAGIRAVLLSTTEGVPLGRVYAGDEPLNEEVLAALESVWAPASKQIPALGMEKVHQVTAIYDHGTLIHVYQAPVVCV
jgi:predicted regulator of Ras-like GTPase activity (Roadblock/LC7/MglB family)